MKTLALGLVAAVSFAGCGGAALSRQSGAGARGGLPTTWQRPSGGAVTQRPGPIRHRPRRARPRTPGAPGPGARSVQARQGRLPPDRERDEGDALGEHPGQQRIAVGASRHSQVSQVSQRSAHSAHSGGTGPGPRDR